jgi:galactoside O-acetyltransferase
MNQAYSLGLRSVGEDVTIWPLAKVVSPATITIGDSVIVDDFVFLAGGSDTRIGSFVHIAAHSLIAGGGELVLDDFAGLSGGVRVYTGNEDYLGGCLTNPAVPAPWRVPIRGRVVLGRHAIVGANAVILPGVELGEGCVVGANSLVARSCEPWTIYAGSPAKPIKQRPRQRILELEAELRRTLYDSSGRYIPRHRREGGAPG